MCETTSTCLQPGAGRTDDIRMDPFHKRLFVFCRSELRGLRARAVRPQLLRAVAVAQTPASPLDRFLGWAPKSAISPVTRKSSVASSPRGAPRGPLQLARAVTKERSAWRRTAPEN